VTNLQCPDADMYSMEVDGCVEWFDTSCSGVLAAGTTGTTHRWTNQTAQVWIQAAWFSSVCTYESDILYIKVQMYLCILTRAISC